MSFRLVGSSLPRSSSYAKRKGKWCPGTWMKRISGVRESGAICIGPSTETELVDSMLAETRHGGSSILLPTPSSRCSTTRARDDGWARFYPRAIAQVLGTDVQHRVSDCLTNRIEQDHRGIKQRYPMLGFGAFESAKRYCQAFDEVRNYFRPCSR